VNTKDVNSQERANSDASLNRTNAVVTTCIQDPTIAQMKSHHRFQQLQQQKHPALASAHNIGIPLKTFLKMKIWINTKTRRKNIPHLLDPLPTDDPM